MKLKERKKTSTRKQINKQTNKEVQRDTIQRDVPANR